MRPILIPSGALESGGGALKPGSPGGPRFLGPDVLNTPVIRGGTRTYASHEARMQFQAGPQDKELEQDLEKQFQKMDEDKAEDRDDAYKEMDKHLDKFAEKVTEFAKTKLKGKVSPEQRFYLEKIARHGTTKPLYDELKKKATRKAKRDNLEVPYLPDDETGDPRNLDDWSNKLDKLKESLGDQGMKLEGVPDAFNRVKAGLEWAKRSLESQALDDKEKAKRSRKAGEWLMNYVYGLYLGCRDLGNLMTATERTIKRGYVEEPGVQALKPVKTGNLGKTWLQDGTPGDAEDNEPIPSVDVLKGRMRELENQEQQQGMIHRRPVQTLATRPPQTMTPSVATRPPSRGFLSAALGLAPTPTIATSLVQPPETAPFLGS